MTGFCITATGTGVGKTVVTRAITRCLVNKGRKVAALKPVESGPEGEESDAELLLAASGLQVRVEDIRVYSFNDPVSPHLAAQRAGQIIDKDLILDLLRRWSSKVDLVLAEGAGGLLVPLSQNLLYGDLMAEAGFPIIIVAENILGTINTTLLTIEAARNRGIPVAGVILNRTPETNLDNAAAIAAHGRVPILGQLPSTPNTDDQTLAHLAQQHLDLTCFAE